MNFAALIFFLIYTYIYIFGKRPTGRPNKRWIDGILKDMQVLKVKSWKELTGNRKKWNNPRRVVVLQKKKKKKIYGRMRARDFSSVFMTLLLFITRFTSRNKVFLITLQFFFTYLEFPITSVIAQVKESVVIFLNSSRTPIPAETVLRILSDWSPYIGIPTTGTPRLTVSCVLRSPPCVMNSLTFG
jgi:hypothetical protein